MRYAYKGQQPNNGYKKRIDWNITKNNEFDPKNGGRFYLIDDDTYLDFPKKDDDYYTGDRILEEEESKLEGGDPLS